MDRFNLHLQGSTALMSSDQVTDSDGLSEVINRVPALPPPNVFKCDPHCSTDAFGGWRFGETNWRESSELEPTCDNKAAMDTLSYGLLKFCESSPEGNGRGDFMEGAGVPEESNADDC